MIALCEGLLAIKENYGFCCKPKPLETPPLLYTRSGMYPLKKTDACTASTIVKQLHIIKRCQLKI